MLKRLFSKFPRKTQQYALEPPADYVEIQDFGGTRTSIPKFTQGGGAVFGALPRRAQRDLNLDDRTLATATVEELLDLLSDAHPDVSYALWNFLRIGNGDYTITVTRPGKDTEYSKGKRAIDEFLAKLEAPNPFRFETSRSFKKVLNQLMLTMVVRGAGAGELVLTPDLDDVAFIAPVDPATVEFKFEDDRYVPYQDDGNLSLDIPTFFYEALDEHVDDPYGRSPFTAAIQMVLFQLQVLNDIKAVVHNQGYPRLDIQILEEVLLKRMPIGIRNNEEKKQKWLNDQLQKIIDMYSRLGPDDTFVHYDSVKLGMVGGDGGGGALLDPQKLMAVVDSLVMSGLKTLSTILGRRSQGNTESFAKLEIKLFIKSVEAVQEVVERLVSRMLTLVLNIKGIQGEVHFQYKPVEIRTALEQAQFEQIAYMNIAFLRDQGWIDQEEAAMRAVGHAPVGEPVKAQVPTNKEGDPVSGTPDEKGTDDTSTQP